MASVTDFPRFQEEPDFFERQSRSQAYLGRLYYIKTSSDLKKFETHGTPQLKRLNRLHKVSAVVSMILMVGMPLGFSFLPMWFGMGVQFPLYLIVQTVKGKLEGKVQQIKTFKAHLEIARAAYKDGEINPIGQWTLPAVDPHLRSDLTIGEERLGRPKRPIAPERTRIHEALDLHIHAGVSIDDDLTPQQFADPEPVQPEVLSDEALASLGVWLEEHEDVPVVDVLYTLPSRREIQAWMADNSDLLDIPVSELVARHRRMQDNPHGRGEPSRRRRFWRALTHRRPPPLPFLPAATAKEAYLNAQLLKIDATTRRTHNFHLWGTRLLEITLLAVQMAFLSNMWVSYGISSAMLLVEGASYLGGRRLKKLNAQKQTWRLHKYVDERPLINRVPGTHPRLTRLAQLQRELGLDGVSATWAKALAEGDEALPNPIDHLRFRELAGEGSELAKPVVYRYALALQSVPAAERDTDLFEEVRETYYGGASNRFPDHYPLDKRALWRNTRADIKRLLLKECDTLAEALMHMNVDQLVDANPNRPVQIAALQERLERLKDFTDTALDDLTRYVIRGEASQDLNDELAELEASDRQFVMAIVGDKRRLVQDLLRPERKMRVIKSSPHSHAPEPIGDHLSPALRSDAAKAELEAFLKTGDEHRDTILHLYGEMHSFHQRSVWWLLPRAIREELV